jgi:hypothetical protein
MVGFADGARLGNEFPNTGETDGVGVGRTTVEVGDGAGGLAVGRTAVDVTVGDGGAFSDR